MSTNITERVEISAEVPLMIIKEGKYYVAYCPAFELSSFGKTEAEAKEYFEDALRIFIKDTVEKGTLEKCLLKFGWHLQKTKYEPPRLENTVDLSNMNLSKTRILKETVPLYTMC